MQSLSALVNFTPEIPNIRFESLPSTYQAIYRELMDSFRRACIPTSTTAKSTSLTAFINDHRLPLSSPDALGVHPLSYDTVNVQRLLRPRHLITRSSSGNSSTKSASNKTGTLITSAIDKIVSVLQNLKKELEKATEDED